jgi:hypothetical protein
VEAGNFKGYWIEELETSGGPTQMHKACAVFMIWAKAFRKFTWRFMGSRGDSCKFEL